MFLFNCIALFCAYPGTESSWNWILVGMNDFVKLQTSEDDLQLENVSNSEMKDSSLLNVDADLFISWK
ncbi:hypothetical protein IHE45_15G010300 [Dioscorea alata]|uniref:Uncharacterized protein n=1 Tax=Dioscorea alata TaxID=55571 RepID=A0ACB7UJV7_DIOAL|nr:hypothetical protein IHE45_15G010300 [Dioscorea alata]